MMNKELDVYVYESTIQSIEHPICTISKVYNCPDDERIKAKLVIGEVNESLNKDMLAGEYKALCFTTNIESVESKYRKIMIKRMDEIEKIIGSERCDKLHIQFQKEVKDLEDVLNE